MKYRKIPGTQLQVSEVGFSVRSLAQMNWDDLDDRGTEHLLRYAIDRGINFFETADSYGDGRAEALIGNALSEERDRVVIATSFGYNFYHEKEPCSKKTSQDFSPAHLRRACEESLKRLRTDHIDLYQIHHPTMSTIERDDLYSGLKKLQKQGKIIAWGAVLGTAGEWLEEAKLLSGLRDIACLQASYNLLEPNPGDEILKCLSQKGAGFIASMPLCSGLLDRRFFRRIHQGGKQPLHHQGQSWMRENAKCVEKFEFLTTHQKRSMGQAALKYVLADPSVVSALVDIDTEDQINEFALTSAYPDLDAEEMEHVRLVQALHEEELELDRREKERAKTPPEEKAVPKPTPLSE